MKNCCCNASVEVIKWHDESAVRFSAGGYEALLIPGQGANLVELKNIKKGYDLLRTPDNFKEFKERPQVYGLPVLFPPNRIEDGTFKVGDKVYNFTVNELKGNNHIHGFLRTRPWVVTNTQALDDMAEVEVSFKSDKNSDFYNEFPHEFEFKILYVLTADGLEQRIKITNESSLEMPMGLGFHTAFNVPFVVGGKAEDCKLLVSVGEEWELTERILPTGEFLALNDSNKRLRECGMPTQGFPYSGHFTNKSMDFNGKEFNGAIIEDSLRGVKLIYEVGTGFSQWMIWNETGDKGFICPEPQTWAVNAPNIKLPAEKTGFKILASGEIWEDFSRISVYEDKGTGTCLLK